VEGQLIKPAWVKACVNAPIEESDPDNNYNSPLIYAGLDIGIKRDKSIICIRRGNKILHIEELPPNDPTQTCLIAHTILCEWHVDKFTYDSCGVGADVKATLDLQFPNHVYEIVAFNGAASAGEEVLPQFNNDMAKDRFFNLRAFSYWSLRTRIKNTHDLVNGIREVDLQKTIILPKHNQDFLNDFSKPTLGYRGKKMLIESKEDMRKRGVSSTDYADAVCYAFYEPFGGDYLDQMYG
jgi:phage terminase large subunit